MLFEITVIWIASVMKIAAALVEIPAAEDAGMLEDDREESEVHGVPERVHKDAEEKVDPELHRPAE
jgi:hypothetical protein